MGGQRSQCGAGLPSFRTRCRAPRSPPGIIRHPGRLPTRPEDGDPVAAQLVRDPRNERRLGADHGEVGAEVPREAEQRLPVLGPDGMAVAEPRDAGIARRGVQRRQPRRLGELPRERVLAPARPDQEHLHGGRVYVLAFGVRRVCA